MHRNSDVAAAAADAAKLRNIGRMTPKDTLSLQATLRMTWSQMRILNSFLINHHAPVLAPEKKVRLITSKIRTPSFTGVLEVMTPPTQQHTHIPIDYFDVIIGEH